MQGLEGSVYPFDVIEVVVVVLLCLLLIPLPVTVLLGDIRCVQQ